MKGMWFRKHRCNKQQKKEEKDKPFVLKKSKRLGEWENAKTGKKKLAGPWAGRNAGANGVISAGQKRAQDRKEEKIKAKRTKKPKTLKL